MPSQSASNITMGIRLILDLWSTQGAAHPRNGLSPSTAYRNLSPVMRRQAEQSAIQLLVSKKRKERAEVKLLIRNSCQSIKIPKPVASLVPSRAYSSQKAMRSNKGL